jgi:hypothetical protein
MKTVLLVLILVHGLIHLLGFIKAFHLGKIGQLARPISRAAGIFWLLTTILFVVAFLFLLQKDQSWWIVALTGVLCSQILIIQSWTDAKFGTIANVIILLPIIVSFFDALPSSYQNRYRSEVQKRLSPISDVSIVSEDDIRYLPDIVQRYLRYAGAVGKPKVQNFRAIFRGEIKRSAESSWMYIYAQQYDFFKDRARFFYIRGKRYGIPFDGLHIYAGNSATMEIKVASLFQVTDAKGEKMNQGETVTLFNDICFFAPAVLIEQSIQWESIDSLTVKATFTNNDITITALLYFNDKGELTNFISNDRFHTTDGKIYTSYPWSTPVREYRDFGGRKMPWYGEAIWHTPKGEYSYAKFNLAEIEYNCSEYK